MDARNDAIRGIIVHALSSEIIYLGSCSEKVQYKSCYDGSIPCETPPSTGLLCTGLSLDYTSAVILNQYAVRSFERYCRKCKEISR